MNEIKYTQYIVRLKGGHEQNYFRWEWNADIEVEAGGVYVADAPIAEAALFDHLHALGLDIKYGKFTAPNGAALTRDQLEIVQLDIAGTVLPQPGESDGR